MRSVTDQLNSDNGVDPQPGDPRQLANLIDSTMPEPVIDTTLEEQQRVKRTEAKLRLAYATRGAVAAPTGVKLVCPGRDQVQEIFDDGSVRNPYKVNHSMTGRQRRKMRKVANRNMRARGLKGKIQDVLKGRRVGTPERPQPATSDQTLVEVGRDEALGMPVALPSGD